MWEVPVQLQVKLPGERRAHLKVEVPFKMSVKATLRHLTLEVQVQAKLRLTQAGLRPKTWLTWQSWNFHILTKMRSTRSGNILKRDISMKKTEHRWIQSSSERVSSASWFSWMSLGVGEPCDRLRTGKVWSTRWCYQRRGDAVSSRFVVRQFREGADLRVHAGTPGSAAARLLLILSAIQSLFAATADFSVAFMHSPVTEEVFVELPPEANLPRGRVRLLRRALYGLRSRGCRFSNILGEPA